MRQELDLATTKKNLDNYKLTAPFDGIVRKLDFQVGDNLTNDEQKYIYIENPDLIQVSILFDQIDIRDVTK